VHDLRGLNGESRLRQRTVVKHGVEEANRALSSRLTLLVDDGDDGRECGA